MSDRKRFSKRREEAIWRVVDKAVTDLRIQALRGKFSTLNNNSAEDFIWNQIGALPDIVCAEYRKSLAP
jgi:hypothetical protein